MKTAAHAQLHATLLREASRFHRRRHVLAESGDNLDTLLKADFRELYSVGAAPSLQREQLRPYDVDEPDYLDAVNMLDALPADEAEFYASEENLLLRTGYSQVLFEDIERQYAFVGGSYEDYARYFNRELPAGMWGFVTCEGVAAVSGFASLPKKKNLNNANCSWRALLIVLLCLPRNALITDFWV